MQIKFTKMHGLGNDFMMIDAVRQKISLTPEIIRQWSDRHTGLGFDQLLLIEPTHNNSADFFYRIFNADGSEVSQCGNGARCLAHFLQDEQLTDKKSITVETINGLLELKIEADGQVTVNMGAPVFLPSKIPFLAEQERLSYKITIDNNIVTASVLSIGNPHCVLLVDDVKTAPVAELGASIEKHKLFPERTNVSFMQIIDPTQIKLRVFERGAGETQACGSGACAAVVAGNLLGLLNSKVSVQQPGGMLQVAWQKNGPVFLTGPATKVFRGTIEI